MSKSLRTIVHATVWYAAVSAPLLPTMVSDASSQAAAAIGISKQEMFGTVVYKSKWPIKDIPVCWQSMNPDDAKYRAIVERAVQETWVAAGGGRIAIPATWPLCTPDAPGIHIAVEDSTKAPHTIALGRYLDRRDSGMVLNFRFENWSERCQTKKDFCVYAIAAHEFGHALGLTHEQNRDDAPPECRDEKKSGSVGDMKITKYDPASIMNYCNPKWNGEGKLSALDVQTLLEFY